MDARCSVNAYRDMSQETEPEIWFGKNWGLADFPQTGPGRRIPVVIHRD